MWFLRFMDGNRCVRAGVSDDDARVDVLNADFDFFAALARAIDTKEPLPGIIARSKSGERLDKSTLLSSGRLLSPVPTQAGPGTCLVTGTGLTHFRSAEIRDTMASEEDGQSDSMKMYAMGKEGGQPGPGQFGVQPEWFFKGTAECLLSSGQDIVVPPYALTAGEEAELAGVYYITEARTPVCVGYVLINDLSDHELEEKNYLYLAPSKLRMCPIGPEMLIGEVSDDVAGTTAIRRGGDVVWQRDFKTGNANMTHSIGNLEHHHFKHQSLLTPGDMHIYSFGCPVFSYGDAITLQDGDELEMSVPEVGAPLKNTVRFDKAACEQLVAVRRLG